MSEFVTHMPCPKCGSKDNLSVYSDGYKECMSVGCDYYEKSSGGTGTKKSETKKHYQRVDVPKDGIMPSKIFSNQTVTNYNVYRYSEGRDEWVIFPTYVDNIPVAYKKRLFRRNGQVVWKAKTIAWGKDGDAKPGLFGMQACRGKDGIIITEGEFDAMAAYEMYGLKYDCVSITKGANGAANCIKDHLQFLKSYKEIIICFDNDEVGQIFD